MTFADFSGLLSERIDVDPRRVVVIDDDPTGTQTVSGVDVILEPGRAAYERFFAGSARSIYVLSNSRALDRPHAIRLVRTIARELREAAAAAGRSVAIVLRGDSTLRGHVFAEVDAVGAAPCVTLLAPALPEAGRTTVDGIQWLALPGERRIPVADTEFANDPTFGYRSLTIAAWVAEVGCGRSTVVVPLEAIRSVGPAAIRDALLSAPDGTVVVPEAESRQDLVIAAIGLLEAEALGRAVVVRSAGTFAAIRAGLDPHPIDGVAVAPPGRVLTVCGSHTAATTSQLLRLAEASGAAPREVAADAAAGRREDRVAAVADLTAVVRSDLLRDGSAIIATPRANVSGDAFTSVGAPLMQMLVEVVTAVRSDLDGVISKGGITSAEVARRGLGASRARVCGQLAPGVALWDVPSVGRHVPCAIVPGNVGGPETLVDIARAFGVAGC